MIEIKNFLTEKTCKDCIDFFNKNYSKTKIFHKRKKLNLLNLTKINVKMKNLLDKYSKIYPGYNISNFEILKWPIGEYHDWHTDTIYYDKTTITYLNKDYKGGRTTVDNYTVEPETGKIILFDSGIRHKVSPLTEGERYVMLVWYNLIKREEL